MSSAHSKADEMVTESNSTTRGLLSDLKNNNPTSETASHVQEKPQKTERRSYENLPAIVTVLLVSSVPIVAGFAIGFSSPASESLGSEDDVRLRLDAEQITWFGSIVMLASLIGSICSAPSMERFGRRISILATLFIFLVGWLFLLAAENIVFLYLGRVLQGIAFGATITVVPVYMGEIGPPNIRGSLGILFNFSLASGVLVAFGFGAILKWRGLSQVATGIACFALLCCSRLPESPYWLLKRGEELKAAKAFMKLYRGGGKKHSGAIQRRIAEFWSAPKQPKASFSVAWLTRRQFYQPMSIVVCLHAFQHFTGINAIIFYSHSIFSTAGFKDEHLPSILVGGVQATTMLFTVHLVERLGRRKSLILSSLGAAVCQACLGACMFLLSRDDVKQSHSSPDDVNATVTSLAVEGGQDVAVPVAAWIAMFSVLAFIAFFAMGLGPIAFLALGEILPLSYRGFGSGVATCVNGLSAFLVIKSFRLLATVLHIYGVFWSFAAVSLLSGAFAWQCFPETKGKSLIEIEALFDDKKTIDADPSKDDVTKNAEV